MNHEIKKRLDAQKHDLRIFFAHYPLLIKSVAINRNQRDLVFLIDSVESVTSREIADKLDISIESASSRLKTLYEKGYLTRENIMADSGGIEYWYSSNI
jgi:DNA-binding MarR family transcriptional regulator